MPKTRKQVMDAEEFGVWLVDNCYTLNDLAADLGMSFSGVFRLREGERGVTQVIALALRELARDKRALARRRKTYEAAAA